MQLHEHVCRSIDVEIGDHATDLAGGTGPIGRLHMSLAVLSSRSSNPSASLPLRVHDQPIICPDAAAVTTTSAGRPGSRSKCRRTRPRKDRPGPAAVGLARALVGADRVARASREHARAPACGHRPGSCRSRARGPPAVLAARRRGPRGERADLSGGSSVARAGGSAGSAAARGPSPGRDVSAPFLSGSGQKTHAVLASGAELLPRTVFTKAAWPVVARCGRRLGSRPSRYGNGG
jgi:hypothetical protein